MDGRAVAGYAVRGRPEWVICVDTRSGLPALGCERLLGVFVMPLRFTAGGLGRPLLDRGVEELGEVRQGGA